MGNEVGKNSGMGRRLIVILGVFVIVAGGIWGYRQYLKSTVPKPDPEFVKERAPSTKPPAPEPSGLEVLGEIFSGSKPSKEMTELQGKTADEVVFTYDAIMKMTPAELEKNIKDVTEQLESVRKSLPPSLGGASFGSSEPPKTTEPTAETEGKKTASVPSLALPLEVMRQVSESRK